MKAAFWLIAMFNAVCAAWDPWCWVGAGIAIAVLLACCILDVQAAMHRSQLRAALRRQRERLERRS
jgi:hypothetical protein